jgi:hypothetical protein
MNHLTPIIIQLESYSSETICVTIESIVHTQLIIVIIM